MSQSARRAVSLRHRATHTPWPALLLTSLLTVMPVRSMAAPYPDCSGDCSGDGTVSISEVVLAINIALGLAERAACLPADANGDGSVSITELVYALQRALDGCSAPPVTALTGICRQPGNPGLRPCNPATQMVVARCDDRARCLTDADARTVLASGLVDPAGNFALAVSSLNLTTAPLLVWAEVTDGAAAALPYRALVRTTSPATAGAAATASAADASGIVVDPSAEGVVRTVDTAGLERVPDTDVEQLTEQVRTDPDADYAGMTPADAATAAAAIAFDMFFVNPWAIAMSPDGADLYAAGSSDNAIAAFHVDQATGELTFLEVQRSGVGGVDGLNDTRSVAVSPDGAHVYGAGGADNALAVFSRDVATGRLSFVEVVRNGSAGVSGLGSVQSVTVSADGAHVYTASLDNAVAVFRRDADTGQLAFVQELRDGADGVDGIASALAVALSPDGAHAYVASFTDNAVTAFARDAATGRLSFIAAYRGSVGGISDLQQVSSVHVGADGSLVYATAYNGSPIAVFRRDLSTGRLTFVQGTSGGLSGANAIAASPDGASIYAVSDRDLALAVFSGDAASGMLTAVDVLHGGTAGTPGLEGVNAVSVSADGAYVYTAALRDAAVAVFRRDAATSGLSPAGLARAFFVRSVGLDGVRGATVSPDGAHLYAAGTHDDSVVTLRRDAQSGALTVSGLQRDGVDGVNGIQYVESLTISPDGANVYAASSGEDTLAVFRRDAASGALTYMDVLRESPDFIGGLFDVTSLAVSPDGLHIYAAGANNVSVFARDLSTGALTPRPVQAAHGASCIAVSPDGKHLYSTKNDFVTVYSRDALSGDVTQVELLENGVDGVEGLGANVYVTFSPGGAYAYVAALADAVVVFARDPGSGHLTFVECYATTSVA